MGLVIVDGYSRYLTKVIFYEVVESEKLGGTTCLLKLVPIPGTGFFIFIRKATLNGAQI
ncbi:hypothetical protein [Neobacillus sp. NPDC093127]|uniref:hypothetical protein n=1 Tax=Neobacillus sp. NPDC093127 TaxID=3364296 RepID=UPI00380CAE62